MSSIVDQIAGRNQNVTHSFAPVAMSDAALRASAPTPNVGQPTSFWARLAQIGAAKVQQLNLVSAAQTAGRFVKSTAEDTLHAAEKTSNFLNPAVHVASGEINKKLTQANQQVQQTKAPAFVKQQVAQKVATERNNVSNQLYGYNAADSAAKKIEKVAGNAVQTATMLIPGAGSAAEKGGAILLKQLGEHGVLNLAQKAGVDATKRGAEDVAQAVAKTKVGRDAVYALTKGSQSIAKRILTSSAKGAAGFGAFGAGQAAAKGGSAKEVIKSGAEGAAVGAVTGVAGSAAKQVIERLRGKVAEAKPIQQQAAQHQAAEKMASEKGLPQGKIQAPKQLPTGKIESKALPAGKSVTKSGSFVMQSPEQSATAKVVTARVKQIDKIVSAAQKNGTTKNADELRSLMRERQGLLDVASGKKTVDEIQSKISGSPALQKLTVAAKSDTRISDTTTSPTAEKASTTATSVTKAGRKISGSSLKSEQRAIAQGLEKEFEDKATYKAGSYTEEAGKALHMVEENPDKAYKIATGSARATNPITEVAVRRAVERKALAEGDYDTLRELAASKQHTKTSEAAQRLGAEGYNREPDSPVEAMRQVSEARVAVAEKKFGTTVEKATNDTAKEIDRNIKRPTKQSWAMFIESIKC